MTSSKGPCAVLDNTLSCASGNTASVFTLVSRDRDLERKCCRADEEFVTTGLGPVPLVLRIKHLLRPGGRRRPGPRACLDDQRASHPQDPVCASVDPPRFSPFPHSERARQPQDPLRFRFFSSGGFEVLEKTCSRRLGNGICRSRTTLAQRLERGGEPNIVFLQGPAAKPDLLRFSLVDLTTSSSTFCERGSPVRILRPCESPLENQ